MERSYRDLDENQFTNDIRGIDPDYLYNDPSPNVVWKKMYNHFVEVADRHCPIRRLKVHDGGLICLLTSEI